MLLRKTRPAPAADESVTRVPRCPPPPTSPRRGLTARDRLRIIWPSSVRIPIRGIQHCLVGFEGRVCPVPLTVRGTQALVSFAPLAFIVSLRAASCTLCVELTGYFSSKSSANSDPCFVRVAKPLAGRPGGRGGDLIKIPLGTIFAALGTSRSVRALHRSYLAHRTTFAARRASRASSP